MPLSEPFNSRVPGYLAHSDARKFRGEVTEWDEALATGLTSVLELAAEWQSLLPSLWESLSTWAWVKLSPWL
jgi:hypothetical protein